MSITVLTKNYFDEKSEGEYVPKIDSIYITNTICENTFLIMFIVQIERIKDLGINVKLKNPLEFSYKFKDGLHMLINDELQITCSAESYEQCMKDVQEELAVLWREIVMHDDSELAPDAIRVKLYLLSLAEH